MYMFVQLLCVCVSVCMASHVCVCVGVCVCYVTRVGFKGLSIRYYNGELYVCVCVGVCMWYLLCYQRGVNVM